LLCAVDCSCVAPSLDLSDPAVNSRGSFLARLPRLTVAWKFFLVLLVMAPLMVGVAAVGLSGLTTVQGESQRLRTDNLHTSLVTGDLNELVARRTSALSS
jgi:hypothetical protein